MSRGRAVLLVWLLLTALTLALHLQAQFGPSRGRVFVGTFHWIDDVYNYLSYVQQSEAGHFLFRNKLLDPAEARPLLVNLEWWIMGRASAVMGSHPMVAFRLLGILATLALVAGTERWLSRAGVPASHRLAALMLVMVGGGLGGLLFELTDLPTRRCLDLSVAIFPYLSVLANPHFVAGTALLCWALWCFAFVRAPFGPVLGVLLGTVLGLVRPYDLVLLGIVRGGAVLLTRRPDRWLRDFLPLVGLVPVLGYNLFVFFGTSQFATFRIGAAFPAWIDVLPAVGPGLLLALLSLRGEQVAADERDARMHLWMWVAVAAAVIGLRPGSFFLQLLVGSGLPLMVLAATALRRLPADRTVLAALCLCTSAVAQTRIMLSGDPNWFVPRERLAVAEALRPLCSDADRLLAPPDISLYAMGLSSCHVVVAHPVASDYESRVSELREFYSSASPAARLAMLDRDRVTYVVLPGDAGPRAEAWLGPGAPFQLVARTSAGSSLISVYGRQPPRSGDTSS